eukprot:Partr_v1_DN25969_c1_g1_i3_m68463 putative Cyclin-dependent protein kinase
MPATTVMERRQLPSLFTSLPNDIAFLINAPLLVSSSSPLEIPISESMIMLLASRAETIVKVHEDAKVSSNFPPLTTFIRQLIGRSEVKAPVIFLATVYLDRLRTKLPQTARGLPCTRHRVFLAALIVAQKYLNDIIIKNRVWASLTDLFPLGEVNLMERQFLLLVDFNLNFNQSDIAEYCMNFEQIAKV